MCRIWGFGFWWAWVAPQVFACPLTLERYLPSRFYHLQNGRHGNTYINDPRVGNKFWDSPAPDVGTCMKAKKHIRHICFGAGGGGRKPLFFYVPHLFAFYPETVLCPALGQIGLTFLPCPFLSPLPCSLPLLPLPLSPVSLILALCPSGANKSPLH